MRNQRFTESVAFPSREETLHVQSSRDVKKLDKTVMSVEIVRGTSQKPVSSDVLAEIIARQSSLSGRLFIRYPIINSSTVPYPIDALLVSPDKGIVVFNLIMSFRISPFVKCLICIDNSSIITGEAIVD